MTRTSENSARWCAGTWLGRPPDAAFSAVFHDTREAVPGGLYVAICGERLDGHDFVEQAFEAGAAGAVVSRDQADRWRTDAPGALLVVEDTRRALLDMAAGYRKTLRGLIIGVTGSVGKTTVKEMVADVLACRGATARTRGNRNNDLGLPLSLLAMNPEDAFGVFEAGINHPGEMQELMRVLQPDWGIITLVGAAHLGFFDGEETIAREKAELFRALPGGGTAVLDVDQPWADLLLSRASCRRLIVSSSGRKDADFSLVPCDGTEEMRVRDRQGGREVTCRLPLPGRHIRQDALLALATGFSLGVDAEAACRALAAYTPVGMRWRVEQVAGTCFINDAYNANPLSMRAALSAFAELSGYSAKWLVLGGMGELGGAERAEHEKLGADLAGGPWAGLFTVGAIAEGIADGAEEAGMPARRIFRCADTKAAADRLHACAPAANDAVLIKASRSGRLEEVLSLYATMNQQKVEE